MASKKKTNPHDGHKERMREKFLKSPGFETFAEHEILELMLNYILIRQNTNEIAHALIDKFGSLDGVLRASIKELCEIKGIGMRCAVFLKMQYALLRYYNSKIADNAPSPGNVSEEALMKLMPLFSKLNVEKMYIVTITNANKIKNIKCIAEGETSTVYVSRKKIVTECLMDNAEAVIIAHNHPGGKLRPSDEDMTFTKQVNSALKNIEIKLIEHYIIGEDKFYPIMKNNLFEYKSF